MKNCVKGSGCADKVSEADRTSAGGTATTTQYSLNNGVLPSLGARSNRVITLSRFIISPFDYRYK